MKRGDKVTWTEQMPVTVFEDKAMIGKITHIKPDGTIVVKVEDDPRPGHTLLSPEEVTQL